MKYEHHHSIMVRCASHSLYRHRGHHDGWRIQNRK